MDISPYTLQWAAPSHQNCHFPWGSGPLFNTWFLGPTGFHTQMASRLVQPFFAGLAIVTDKLTYRATLFVKTGRIYVHSTAMRPRKCD